MIKANAGLLHFYNQDQANGVGTVVSGDNAMVTGTKVVFVPNPNYHFTMTPVFGYVCARRTARPAHGLTADVAALMLRPDQVQGSGCARGRVR